LRHARSSRQCGERVTEEFLERLDQWRALHLSGLSRTATVVAIIEERIRRDLDNPPEASGSRPGGQQHTR
jgi:hypothetical protein